MRQRTPHVVKVSIPTVIEAVLGTHQCANVTKRLLDDLDEFRELVGRSGVVGRFALLRLLAHRVLVGSSNSLKIIVPDRTWLMLIRQLPLEALPLTLRELSRTRVRAHRATRRSIHA